MAGHAAACLLPLLTICPGPGQEHLAGQPGFVLRFAGQVAGPCGEARNVQQRRGGGGRLRVKVQLQRGRGKGYLSAMQGMQLLPLRCCL